MPNDFAIHFRLRGHGPANDFEFKLIDETGRKNVWRHVQKRLEPPARWRRVRIQSRDIDFAWGPDSGHSIVARSDASNCHRRGRGRQGVAMDRRSSRSRTTPARTPIAVAERLDHPSHEAGWAWPSIDCLVFDRSHSVG